MNVAIPASVSTQAPLFGARIAAISTYFPKIILDNANIAAINPSFQPAKVEAKTGIVRRYIAASDETSSDLAVRAAEVLFLNNEIVPGSIDYLIFCTQAPDYILPTSACLIHRRLGLREDAGAIDINLGCSGFVYGLGQATGLIAAGQARRVLLLTADTYSKFIDRNDIGVLTIFGDGAAATLIEAALPSIGPFVYGTDGYGAEQLIIRTGGARFPVEAGQSYTDINGTTRSGMPLQMNGPDVFNFSMRAVPKLVQSVLAKAGMVSDDIDLYVFHQANSTMLESLRRKLEIPRERFWVDLTDGGNTVSSTIPIALSRAAQQERLMPGMTVMLVGFGVGLSWGGTILRW